MSEPNESRPEKAAPWERDESHGWLWNLIDRLLYQKENRERHLVNRKTYLRLCWLGIFGAHHFYAKRPFWGVVYLLFFWSGLSAAMTLIDAMIAIPMKPDENGNIWL